jgi:hypothetical protein
MPNILGFGNPSFSFNRKDCGGRPQYHTSVTPAVGRDLRIIQRTAYTNTGNPVRYSFTEDFTFNTYTSKANNITKIITLRTWPIVKNGTFKKFSSVFTATGIPGQVFLLDGLNPSNLSKPIYIDHNNFHVYIETNNDTTGELEYIEFQQVESLVQEATFNDKFYELRLNENKDYTIKFGDNIHGYQLSMGTRVHIIYLESNGEDGKIDVGELQSSTLELNIEGFANTTELLNMCFGRK